ncbi:MAG: nuclear transport factor 2 family protein [Flavobacteriaceae bacterium]|nr:nuclear transport factor 2 family protein [Flavobacteriaceae bacterium]
MLKVILVIVAFLTSIFVFGQTHEIPKYKPENQSLYNEIVKMDSIFFTAYNKCDMKTQANILSEDIEFFHDKGGLATSKKDILESLKKNICDKVTRTLIKGSVEVYPINNYGAVQIGYHKFFNKLEPNQKSIPSKFITIWKKELDGWKITRVISLHN